MNLFSNTPSHENNLQLPEIKIVYDKKVKAADRFSLTTSSDAYQLFKKHWNQETIDFREEMYVLYLNRNNKVLGIYPLAAGGITGVVADIRIILAVALGCMACAIIIAHNHPSGNTKPSSADQQLTQKLKEAAKLHDISLIDHIILGEDSYLSFADEGLL